ncbi:OLC1v1026819C1 [Oldenlandia corymbosa var. corymbosa]|uniref:OLC1v1026819C1 n=1 Tax=Oldenlandia corymbosa var. corymbosa TaxID=529605 RepID=A0AAV1C7Y6_OLDCO|nr:OLC1v1026819C1 [Oldenlandia corymbosa var. corymbosa]
MAISDIDAVVEFLRNNGFSDSESALMEDVMEKSQLGSSDFQRFLFPMVPPPPPVKIPATSRRHQPGPPPDDAGGLSSASDDDEDEFVSLASSTTELCSSDFTNPYGIRTTTRPSSQASSDRMSQFGTARDYHEFDMQNDLYWYKEKDEDYIMPPLFGMSDLNGDPTEDKFVMTVETGNSSDYSSNNHISETYHSLGNVNFYDGQWPIAFEEKKDNASFNDYYDFKRNVQPKGIPKTVQQDFVDHSYPAPLYACSGEAGRNYAEDTADFANLKEKVTDEDTATGCDAYQCIKKNSTHDCNREFKSPELPEIQGTEENYHPDENGHCQPYENGVVASETYDPDPIADEGVAAPSDELLAYETKEEDYEVFSLRIIHRKNRTGFEEHKDFHIILNSIVAGRYYITEYLGSAAFSKVARAHDLHTGADVCLKIIKNDKDFFDQSLDEIKLLKYVNKHDPADKHHILRLYDYFYHQEHLFIVCELLRANLYEFQKFNKESGGEPYFTLSRLQAITQQCLEALEYLHGLGIMHCDLKPENILIKSYRRCEIKVIDLGSSCFQTDNLSLYVQSRSYRAPEVILGLSYDPKIDIWSLGCILAELYSGEVLFPNEAIALILARMVAVLGPIDMEMLQMGQETHKYFTKEYDLYYMNEVCNFQCLKNQVVYILMTSR